MTGGARQALTNVTVFGLAAVLLVVLAVALFIAYFVVASVFAPS